MTATIETAHPGSHRCYAAGCRAEPCRQMHAAATRTWYERNKAAGRIRYVNGRRTLVDPPPRRSLKRDTDQWPGRP